MFTTNPTEITLEEDKEDLLFTCSTKDDYTPAYINPNSKEKTIPSLFCATIQWHF